jgi:hypothetical protein
MTDRFVAKGRACKQSEQEVAAAVLTAAAGPQGPLQLLQQLKQARPATAKQQPGLDAKLHILAGSAQPTVVYGLHLQLHRLHEACLQLRTASLSGFSTSTSTSSSSSSSASRFTEVVVAQHAAAAAADTFICLERATQLLCALQLRPWQESSLALYSQQQLKDRSLGMALLLQTACSDVLFSCSKLLQLLQGVQEPSYWRQLQSSIPAQGKGGKDGRPGPAAAERLHHLMQLQVYLLAAAQALMHSLWVCRAVAAAVSAACTGRRWQAGHAAACQPMLLTAVLGPAATTVLVTTAAAASLSPEQPTDSSPPQPQLAAAGKAPSSSLQMVPSLVALTLLLMVQLNEGSFGQQQQQQQQQQRSWVPVQYVESLEQLDAVMVSKDPCDSSTSGSCASSGTYFLYAGTLAQQAGCNVWVVGLSPLHAPDVSRGLPTKRVEAQVQQQQAQFTASAQGSICCPICLGVMTDPVSAADSYVYCRACIEQHISGLQAAGKPVLSPTSGAPMPSTALVRNMHLRAWIEHFRTEEAQNLKRVRKQVQQQVQQPAAQSSGHQSTWAWHTQPSPAAGRMCVQ